MGQTTSREDVFLNTVLPVIMGVTDFTDPNNRKLLAVCLSALAVSFSLATRLNGGYEEDHYQLPLNMVYNFTTLIYSYAAMAMLSPDWFTMPRFWVICAFVFFLTLFTM